ncbi:MAG: STAS domain-containing protein [Myxococcota bacterium]
MAQENHLEVKKVVDNNILALQLNGNIDESFNGKQLADGLKDILIIDFSGVKRISSFGIREWLEFLKIANDKCEAIYYIKAPSRIIDQFNMVANFGGKGEILSFFAPYHCDFCDEDHSRLVDVQDKFDEIKELNLPDHPCEECGEAEYLDEDPESFLSYLETQEKPEPEPEVVAFLSHRLKYKVSRSKQKLKIDMHVGEATFVRLTGDLDSGFKGKKLAEGIEGNIIFDLNALGDILDDAIPLWIEMINAMKEYVENIYIIGASQQFVEKLVSPESLGEGKVKIVDLYLPYKCKKCNTTIDQHVLIDNHYEVIKFATAPELDCPDCSGKSTIQVDENILTKLSTLAKPEFDKKLESFVKSARDSIKQANKPVAPPRESSQSRSNLVLFLGMLIFLIIILGGGYYLVKNVFKEEKKIQTVQLVKASSSEKPNWVEKVKKNTSENSENKNTPDKYSQIVDRNRVIIDGNTVKIFARSEFAVNPQQGINQAKGWALDLYVETLADRISDKNKLWQTVIRGLYSQTREDLINQYSDAMSDPDLRRVIYNKIKEYHNAVAKSFKIAFGKDINPTDVYWEKYLKKEKTGEKDRTFYKVWIKMEMPENVTKKMVKYFSRVEKFKGVSIVNFFPGLNWAFTKTARGPVVVQMDTDSEFQGILKVGYVLSKIQNDELIRLSDFKDKFESLYKVQQEKGQCNLIIHYKTYDTDHQNSRNSTSQYNWKCPEKEGKTKIIIKNVPDNKSNTGFQGNIWNDPSQ